MKVIMLQDEVKTVEARIRQFEENTGCELLLIVAEQSDEYPAAPFRFGLIGAFLFTLVFSHYFEFAHAELWPLAYLMSALVFTWIGRFSPVKRLALADVEILRESREKAVELFHTLGSSKVTHQVTAMIMVSLLERQIHVLVDRALSEKLPQAELDELVLTMQKNFKAGDMTRGFIESIALLEGKILRDFGGKVGDKHPGELQDTIIFL